MMVEPSHLRGANNGGRSPHVPSTNDEDNTTGKEHRTAEEVHCRNSDEEG